MADYTKTTNFATKDSLAHGDPNKVVKGTEINTEFDNIATSSASKADTDAPNSFTGVQTFDDDLTFTGTAKRFNADFSNATVASRRLFKTSTTNGNTYIGAIPNGTGTKVGWESGNYTYEHIVNGVTAWSYTPSTTSHNFAGNIGVNTTASFTNIYKGMELQNADASAGLRIERTGAGASVAELYNDFASFNIHTIGAYPLVLGTNNTARVTIDSSGNETHTGAVTVKSGTATPAGGTAGAGLMFGTTTNFGIFYGSGAPTLSAGKGSLYLRSDGSTTNDRMYINTDSGTTWTAVITAA